MISTFPYEVIKSPSKKLTAAIEEIKYDTIGQLWCSEVLPVSWDCTESILVKTNEVVKLPAEWHGFNVVNQFVGNVKSGTWYRKSREVFKPL